MSEQNKPKRYVSREFVESDIAGVVELYNLITGRDRTIENHRWEWLKNPTGSSSMWVIEDTAENQIVGHHGLISVPCTVNGKHVLAGKTENTILHPNLLGTGLYFRYEREYVKEAMTRFDFLYTTQGSGVPGRIRKQLGYEFVGDYELYIRFLCKGKRLYNFLSANINRKIKHPAIKVLALGVARFFQFTSLVAGGGRQNNDKQADAIKEIFDIDQISDEIDLFWDQNQEYYGITVERKSDFLRWRIFQNPYIKHRMFAYYFNEKFSGYAITAQSQQVNSFSVIRVIDIAVAQNSELILEDFLEKLSQNFYSENIDTMSLLTIFSSNALNKGTQKSGFIKTLWYKRMLEKLLGNGENDMSKLMVKTTKTAETVDFFDVDNWYYTEIFNEGIS